MTTTVLRCQYCIELSCVNARLGAPGARVPVRDGPKNRGWSPSSPEKGKEVQCPFKRRGEGAQCALQKRREGGGRTRAQEKRRKWVQCRHSAGARTSSGALESGAPVIVGHDRSGSRVPIMVTTKQGAAACCGEAGPQRCGGSQTNPPTDRCKEDAA